VLAHQKLRPQGALLLVALHWGPDALLAVEPQEQQAGAGAWSLAWVPQQAREQPQAPLASLPRDLAPRWVPQAAQQAQREPVQQPESLELLLAQRELPDGLRADVPQAHQRRVPRVSPEPESLHVARAASARLLPPLLSPRAPHRLLLRRRQHPSSDAGLSPQLRRRSNWSAFSFPLRQIPEEGQ
jgi:hypothetical protein